MENDGMRTLEKGIVMREPCKRKDGALDNAVT